MGNIEASTQRCFYFRLFENTSHKFLCILHDKKSLFIYTTTSTQYFRVDTKNEMFICFTPLVYYRTIFYVLLLLPIKTPLFITATPPTRMHYNVEYMFSMAPSSKPSLFFVTCTPLHTYRINRGVKSIYCSNIRGFVHCYASCKISVKLIVLQTELLII